MINSNRSRSKKGNCGQESFTQKAPYGRQHSVKSRNSQCLIKCYKVPHFLIEKKKSSSNFYWAFILLSLILSSPLASTRAFSPENSVWRAHCFIGYRESRWKDVKKRSKCLSFKIPCSHVIPTLFFLASAETKRWSNILDTGKPLGNSEQGRKWKQRHVSNHRGTSRAIIAL